MADTIFALASGSGRAAVAVMRVSGPLSASMLETMCGRLPKPRQATLRFVRDSLGERIDQGLVLWFPSPNSFTGEDLFELQLHGGAAVIAGVADTLAGLGARPAEPGEFTRRAFECGRLDLSQAEAIADLVDAESEAQRKQALAQLDGRLANQGSAWRDALIETLASLEAQIDFPDEDLPPGLLDRATKPLAQLARELAAALADDRGERVRDGLRIALIGPPNAGKSSLLNALVEREAAIVAAKPGTTRDVIDVELLVAGHKVVLSDTAGIREAVDEVEIEGVRRARATAERAQLRLFLVGPDQGEAVPAIQRLMQPGDVVIHTKSDLRSRGEVGAASPPVLQTSTVTPNGLGDLRNYLTQWIQRSLSGADAPLLTRLRHRRLLSEAHKHVLSALAASLDPELKAEDVRLAVRALEKLSGRIGPEDVLESVFSTFCIGK